jgi:CRISPR-associated protein Csm3
MKQLIKKIKINTSITLITGLHIGGNSENVEIGGIDLPVIKLASKDNEPYIPGSSIKGKMRCLLEQVFGASEIGLNSEVNNLFGIIKEKNPDKKNRLSKIVVKDAMLSENSKKMLLGCDNLDLPYTESKWENTIKRIEGVAEHPRQIERVPAGAEFNAEFIINVWDDDDEQALIKLFKKGISLLENDYLGCSGSRGYGQIKFGEIVKAELSEENNWIAIKQEKYGNIQDI